VPLQQVSAAYLARQLHEAALVQQVWHVATQSKERKAQAPHQDALLVTDVHQLRAPLEVPLY
jgi:hypothetical protein